MSIIKQDYGELGGGLSETLLWSNSSPTTTFGGQTINLSASADQYDLLKIVFRFSTTNANEYAMYVKPKEVGVSSSSSTIPTGYTPALGVYDPSYYYNRHFYFLTGYTQVFFSTTNKRSTGTATNTVCIPLAIYGLK